MTTAAPLIVGPADRVFILTGAGISAESGIRTFRDSNGLWEEHRMEDVASPGGWAKDRALVWRFYSDRRKQALSVDPNPAHKALAELEAQIGDRLTLCTQNVDPLHEAGGSKRVIHMHGELARSRCDRDHQKPFWDEQLYYGFDAIPRCQCGGWIRPHICWFGEVPFHMASIQEALMKCTVLVTIGSSGAVYPAAGFVKIANQIGARTVYVGLERPDNAELFSEIRLGRAGKLVPRLFQIDTQ